MDVKIMDTKYEIRNNYIFVKLTGNFDVNHSKEKIIEVNEKLLEHNLDKFFLDITEVTGIDETIGLIYELGEND
jgi:anti-anti-sigma regulatory factor